MTGGPEVLSQEIICDASQPPLESDRYSLTDEVWFSWFTLEPPPSLLYITDRICRVDLARGTQQEFRDRHRYRNRPLHSHKTNLAQHLLGSVGVLVERVWPLPRTINP